MNKDGFKMIDNQDLSVNITSSEVDVSEADYGSIDVTWSGSTPVGEITVEAKSGDEGEWETLSFGSTIDITGNTGSHQLILLQIPYTKMRLQYTASSGTGTLSAIIVTKKFGGVA